MVESCSAYNCTNRHSKKGAGKHITFHSFPKDKTLLKKWIMNMKREKWAPTKHSRICSHHFSADCYETSGWSSRPKLKPDAVPTIFQFLEHLPKPEICIRKAPRKRKHEVEDVELVLQSENVELFLQSENVEQDENSAKAENVQKPKRPRLCYLGDLQKHISEEPEPNPENILAYANLAEKTVQEKNKQIKYLKQKNRRLNKRITNLQSLVLDLLEKNLTTDEAESIMQI